MRLWKQTRDRTVVVESGYSYSSLAPPSAAGSWSGSRRVGLPTPPRPSPLTTSPCPKTGTRRGQGNAQPYREADLAFDVAGRLSLVAVEVGQIVSAGQLVARLDDTQQLYDLASLDLAMVEE